MGAAAGLCVVVGDFVGGWAAVPTLEDGVRLFAALTGLEVPLGGLLGAAIGAWDTLLGRFAAPIAQERSSRRHPERGAPTRGLRKEEATRHAQRRLRPMPVMVLALPAIGALAWMLFTGGAASRVPLRPVWVVFTALTLTVGLYSSLRVAYALLRRVRTSTQSFAAAAIAGALSLHVVATTLDHHVLPGLYDYLHGALTFVRWGTAGLCLALLATRRGWSRIGPSKAKGELRRGIFGCLALLAILGIDLTQLAPDQGLRVAMLSPRCPGSRSILTVLAPTLAGAPRHPTADAIARAEQARAERQLGATRGPVVPGAHLVLITIDALRADHLGAYGYDRRPTSPELDRLAAQSIVFERAYAQVPHSSYSIASLMTSNYLYQRAGLELSLPEATLADVLGGIGYYTAGFYTQGIFHTDGARLSHYRQSGFGFLRRFHDNVDAKTQTDEVLTEVDAIAAAGEPPSFLWVHYFDVHEPYRDTRFGDSDVERYDSEIRSVDAAVSRLLRAIYRQFERPVVVAITADHGEEFRDHGGVYHGSSVYDEQVRVPLIVSVPGYEAARVAQPVELVDLARTLLGLLDVSPPPTMRGDDLRALLEGKGDQVGPAFASAGSRHMIARGPYKLITDIRFGTLELFDLAADPRERDNLARRRPDLVDALGGEVRAWLDSLPGENVEPHELVLRRGRLRDRRATDALVSLLTDVEAAPELRAEAARLLGELPDPGAREALAAATAATNPAVADEAAVALAMLGDPRAAERLRAMLSATDRDLRCRAAIALSRLDDRRAVPALLDALARPSSHAERLEVIHALGMLGDPRAVEPLLALLHQPRFQQRALLALGRIGDRRAIGPLRAQLRNAESSLARDSAARALGQLGDSDSATLLATVAAAGGTPSAAESLVRLGAIGETVGGVDVGPELGGTPGLEGCVARSRDDEWVYLGRTTCHTSRSEVTLSLTAPPALERSTSLILRARRVDTGRAARVSLYLDGVAVGSVPVDGQWSEQHLHVDLRSDPIVTPSHVNATLRVDPAEGRIELDHILLLPAP